MTRRRLAAALLGLFVVTGPALAVPQKTLPTPAEENGYLRYTQNDDIARFLSELAARCPEVKVRVVGRTKDVPGFPARDLFLAVVTEGGRLRGRDLDPAKPTVLLTAAQHGNEQSAKEAALRLLRDVAAGDLKPLLKTLNILVMPQTNPYGNLLDVRTNEIELDMNRDHVKIEAEGVAAIHRAFREYMPDLTIDVHEKGDDYYRVNVGCVSNAAIHASLQDYSRRVLLAEVESALAARRITFHEYLVSEEMGLNTSAGAALRPEDLAGREEMKRYSTTDLNDGRNSPGIFETLSFIQEGASRHDIATLKDRTDYQYWGLRSICETAARHAADIKVMVLRLRKELVAKAATYEESDTVPMRMVYARDPKVPTLTLRQFAAEREAGPRILGTLKADKKAGETVRASDLTPLPSARGPKVETVVVKNWFPDVAVTLSIVRPLGYVIPARHADVVENLLRLGVAVSLFTGDKILDVEADTVGSIVPAKYDYLAPEKIEVTKAALRLPARRGDFYVPCAQPAANLIPCLLELQSDFGLIRYWALKLVPAAGDVWAFYRVTKAQDLPVVPYKEWRE
jgi:hypothetical protein